MWKTMLVSNNQYHFTFWIWTILLSAYASLYFIYMMIVPINWVNIAAYVTELYTSKWRFVSFLISGIPFSPMIFALILYLSRTFTEIHLYHGLATLVILPFYFIVPESPRWLAQNNKEEQALKVLLKMAKINNK